MKKIVFVSSNDEMGQRFSGIDWLDPLERMGYQAKMLIGRKKTSIDSRIIYYKKSTPEILQKAVKYFERRYGTQSRFSPSYLELASRKEWREADIVHYQIVHDGSWFRIEDFPRLTKNKPTIWTWHDAWPITGHCIQPLDCQDFDDKCRRCTHLDWPMQLSKDTAHSERMRKAHSINKSKLNIHVTTNWMSNLIKKSGDFNDANIRVIPFGIDLEKFNTTSKRSVRQKYGIDQDVIVIGIRSSDWVVKNTPLFLKVLESFEFKDKKIEIFSYEKIDAFWELTNLPQSISIRDFGWLEDEALIETYKCLDIFLGISTGESFGLMPLEAAACGAIPIALRGTAVAEFVEKIDKNLVVMNSSDGLGNILKTLVYDDEYRKICSTKSVSVINRDYSLESFLKQLEDFYEEVVSNYK